MVYLNSTISIIAFNISSLNTSANRQGVSYWIKSKTQATYRKLVKYKETNRSKFEGWKKIRLAKLIKKKSQSDYINIKKVYMKTNNITRDN